MSSEETNMPVGCTRRKYSVHAVWRSVAKDAPAQGLLVSGCL